MIARPLWIRSAVVAAAGVTALSLAGCGGSSSGNANAANTPSPTPSSANSGAGGARPAGQFGPAAAGTVAAISGSTMQVQSPQNGQVAVTWSASTKFRHTVALAASAVKAGDCVVAISASATASATAPFTAGTVVVSSPVNGSCTGRFGGGGGFGNRPRPSAFPSGRPSAFPSGRPGAGRGRAGGIASGKVVSVSGSTMVVASRQRASGNGTTTTNRTVTINSTTKVTTEAATTATSVQVGKCVTAQGKADTTGTVAATSVQITDPVNGSCTGGFGGFGRRNNGG